MSNLIQRSKRRESAILTALGLLVCCMATGRARATILYTTSNSGYSEIDQVNTIPQTVSTYLNINASNQPDSIIFDSSGNVIYSAFTAGEVIRYDPITTVSTILATGLSTPADMVLEPGGNTLLVSGFSSGDIDRVNLNTLSVTPLSTGLGNPEGLAYVGSKLFVNIGYRGGGPNGKAVAEINPVTGAIITTTTGLNSLDGLTYDPYSGLLYASSLFGNLVYSIDPNNLANVQIATGTGIVPGPDGITADGIGNIFIASSASDGDSHVYQLNLISHALTQNAFVPGLDDLAPASGLGSIPEPSTFALAGLGVFGLGFTRRRSVIASANLSEPSRR
jgi:streptogramin lyase